MCLLRAHEQCQIFTMRLLHTRIVIAAVEVVAMVNFVVVIGRHNRRQNGETMESASQAQVHYV